MIMDQSRFWCQSRQLALSLIFERPTHALSLALRSADVIAIWNGKTPSMFDLNQGNGLAADAS
jgi:hypothetical protein